MLVSAHVEKMFGEQGSKLIAVGDGVVIALAFVSAKVRRHFVGYQGVNVKRIQIGDDLLDDLLAQRGVEFDVVQHGSLGDGPQNEIEDGWQLLGGDFDFPDQNNRMRLLLHAECDRVALTARDGLENDTARSASKLRRCELGFCEPESVGVEKDIDAGAIPAIESLEPGEQSMAGRRIGNFCLPPCGSSQCEHHQDQHQPASHNAASLV